MLLLSANLAILTFILSQWVFVYQYLKVALLMPHILGLDENEERAVRNERIARRNLMICNFTFVFFSIACILANYVGQINNVWICRRIRPLQGIPYFLLAGVLIFSMCKVKSWLKRSPVQLSLNIKMFWLFILIFISYVFQYLIAYPLHVIHD